MKKIVHLSDLHIGYRDCGTRFQTIVDEMISQLKPAKDYVIVITGDIVNNANHEMYVDEAVSSLRHLEMNGFRVLPVPGNHDYGSGIKGNKKFVKTFKEKFFKNEYISYPKLDIIGKLAFIGLDSTAGELNWNDRFFSEGELGPDQLKRLEKMLEDPRVTGEKKVVYLHHHPFDFKLAMQLKGNEELKKVIENKADAILFGHYHADHDSPGKILHGTWGIPRCYNGGSSTHKNGDPGFQRVIDLSHPDIVKDYDCNFV